ncbi:MAG: hypothetical protein GC134_04065 [Proteobacteria bacterium]|nr:hypothetical protein [Pseudomonadota bacterium]
MDRLIFSNLIHVALRGHGDYVWSASLAVDPYFENRALALMEKLNTLLGGNVRDMAREILEKASIYAAHSHPKALLAKLTADEKDLLDYVHKLTTEMDATYLQEAANALHALRIRSAN